MVTFTGSTEVGRLFLKYSAESNLKEITLECGGKSPAARAGRRRRTSTSSPSRSSSRALMNMGENCSCGSRLIVHRSVHDALVERLAAGLAAWTVGDPMDPATRIGPMIERPHLDKVLGYIERGRAEGARVVAGGGAGARGHPAATSSPRRSSTTSATTMTIAREEIFGPVLSTIPFDSEEEGVAPRQRDGLRARRVRLHDATSTRRSACARRCAPARSA